MKRATLLAFVFYFLLLPGSVPVAAKEKWVSVRSRNFLLVGNTDEKEIRRVAMRLEQFREAFSRLFTATNIDSSVPTTVVIFKSERSYRPFKLRSNTAGYFQSGFDVNYITLTTELQGDQDPFNVIFHEYTHLLVNNISRNMPIWFNEGLAEYYSTFNISGERKVEVGKPITSHAQLLRHKPLLPLRTLFAVDTKSSYYNERDKQSLFYAQSWVLIHYLILANDGRLVPQMGKFIELLSANVPMEQAFQQGFGMTFENMERELRQYIRRDRYPVMLGELDNKIGFNSDMQSTVLTEAESLAYLGDLMLHSDRHESEVYLRKALALDSNLATANASMGILQMRQGKLNEALASLERALLADPQNYLNHYYYAYVLSSEGRDARGMVTGFAPETASRMRQELKKAIELRPDFFESHGLLALVNLVTNSELDEAIQLLSQALASSPGRNDLTFMLAQIYVAKEECESARQTLAKLGIPLDAELGQRVQALLAQIASLEDVVARFKTSQIDETTSRNRSRPRESPADGQHEGLEASDPSHRLRTALREPDEGETRVQGILLRVDCDEQGIMFVVKVGDEMLRLRTAAFKHVFLKSFSSDAGRELTCGPRKPENNVVISYVPPAEAPARIAGEAKSIEFVPHDFKLTPQPKNK